MIIIGENVNDIMSYTDLCILDYSKMKSPKQKVLKSHFVDFEYLQKLLFMKMQKKSYCPLNNSPKKKNQKIFLNVDNTKFL